MTTYIINRLLLIIPTLLGATIIVFAMVRFLPGDVIDVIVSEYGSATQEYKEQLREQYRLNNSIHVQYKDWLWDILRGDLGTSILSGRSIGSDIRRSLPVTFEMGLLALVMSLFISIPVGIIAAIRQDTPLDYIARSMAVVMLALPSFWLATLVITLPNRYAGWRPPQRYEFFIDDPLTNLYIVSVPAAILAFGLAGSQMRLIRTQLLEVMRQDYIRTAWAKGLRERSVVVGHALKNALIPVITLIGVQIPLVVGGTVILELIFGIPGMGTLLIDSIQARDYPVVQALNLLVAIAIVFSNVAVDIAYAYLDPRVRYR